MTLTNVLGGSDMSVHQSYHRHTLHPLQQCCCHTAYAGHAYRDKGNMLLPGHLFPISTLYMPATEVMYVHLYIPCCL